MSIKNKIHLTLLIIIFALLTVSIGVYYSLHQMDEMDAKVTSIHEKEEIGQQIIRKMESIRMNEMHFLAYKTMNPVYKSEEEMEELLTLAEQLRTKATNIEVQNNAIQIMTHIDEYWLRFSQMVTAYREMGLSTSKGLLLEDVTYHEDVDKIVEDINQILFAIEKSLKHEVDVVYAEKAKLKNKTTYILFGICLFIIIIILQLATFSKRLDQLVESRTVELKQSLVKLDKMAKYDALTGLPNRFFLNEYMRKTIQRCKENNKKFAVMFLDLDRFKVINDTLGHEVGDILLKEVSKRLCSSVRDVDIVSRQGGDEFVILLEDADREGIVKVADRIIQAFGASFILNGKEIYTSTSIGVSIYPIDGDDQENLLKNADKSLYIAKENGKNNYQFYSLARDNLTRKMGLENALKFAIQRNELDIHYQPQIDLRTNQLFGLEALLRWENADFGKVGPDEFIPIAEETGLIIPIGKWLLKTVCKQVNVWNDKGFNLNKISINLSASQFKDPNFLEDVKQIFQETEAPIRYLQFEITENIIHNIEQSIFILTELRKLGIHISIDDFGTGYSSLNVLHQLPIDHIKIDRSFIRDMLMDPKMNSLVRTIIEMGKNLNYTLIAEGIENEEQETFLKDLHCQIGQGFLYSKPIPVKEVEKLMMKRQIVST